MAANKSHCSNAGLSLCDSSTHTHSSLPPLISSYSCCVIWTRQVVSLDYAKGATWCKVRTHYKYKVDWVNKLGIVEKSLCQACRRWSQSCRKISKENKKLLRNARGQTTNCKIVNAIAHSSIPSFFHQRKKKKKNNSTEKKTSLAIPCVLCAPFAVSAPFSCLVLDWSVGTVNRRPFLASRLYFFHCVPQITVSTPAKVLEEEQREKKKKQKFEATSSPCKMVRLLWIGQLGEMLGPDPTNHFCRIVLVLG